MLTWAKVRTIFAVCLPKSTSTGDFRRYCQFQLEQGLRAHSRFRLMLLETINCCSRMTTTIQLIKTSTCLPKRRSSALPPRTSLLALRSEKVGLQSCHALSLDPVRWQLILLRWTCFRCRPHLCLFQRYIRPCYRSQVRRSTLELPPGWRRRFRGWCLGDSSGRETICRVTGGMKVKADRDESSPYAAMLAAQDVAARCKELGINALHIKIRATGGT